MITMSRDESLELLSAVLSEYQLRKVMTQGYSDVSMHIMADSSKEHARMLASSLYSPQTINKLSEAYADRHLNIEGYIKMMVYSRHSNRNEQYVDHFLDSLNTVYPETAVKCFNAVNYEDCSYREALAYVQSGAFYPTDHASLSVTAEVAAELYDIDVPLRACEGFNDCYDISDLQSALDRNAAIFVEDKDLVVVVHDLMKMPDWEKYKETTELSVKIMDVTADSLQSDFLSFQKAGLLDALKQKIQSEHSIFLDNMRKKPAESIIQSAHEIVAKETISMYLQNNQPPISAKQCKALLSSPHALAEIYDEWVNNEAWQDMKDVGRAIQETADRILYSSHRKTPMPPDMPLTPEEPEQTVKPKPTTKPRR